MPHMAEGSYQPIRGRSGEDQGAIRRSGIVGDLGDWMALQSASAARPCVLPIGLLLGIGPKRKTRQRACQRVLEHLENEQS